MFNKVLAFSKKGKGRVVAIAAAFAMAVATLGTTQLVSTALQSTAVEEENEAQVAASGVKEYDGISDGTILHAFCWSFDTIKANMKNIAEAGYTAIQTSPINKCAGEGTPMKLMGNSDKGTDGAWWWHYQPTDWKIGNYQLGSRNQFKSMCAEADKYGIKIIVDVVPNHTTPSYNLVANDLLKSTNYDLYHSTGWTPIVNWSDREECTRYQMGGLPDVNTEHGGFQNYFIKYLNDCIACGADGFRYDTAKHIGLPDDKRPNGVNNNFWTRVTTEITNANKIFNYGEVLQGDNERVDSYIDVIGSTCTSRYGERIRDAVEKQNAKVSDLMGMGVASNKKKNLVTWVESHDNYYNDSTYSYIDDNDIRLGWAIITARQNGIPLFFDRPMNSSSWNRYGNNKIGEAGSNLYRDKTVVAVNKFRKAMKGQSEYLRNPNGDESVIMIERGTVGMVIVNVSYDNKDLKRVDTNLANGTYYNELNTSQVFTVSNGKISGNISSRSVVILKSGIEPTTTTTETTTVSPEKIKVYFEKPSNWSNNVNAYVYSENGSAVQYVKVWPGVTMNNVKGNIYSVEFSKSYAGARIIFNDGVNQAPGANMEGFVVKANGLYNKSGYVKTYEDETTTQPTTTPKPTTGKDNIITVYYKTNNSTEYIHYKVGNGSWTTAPGVKMSASTVAGYKSIEINLKNNTKLTACFNDGKGNWDNNGTKDYTFDYSKSTVYSVADGKVTNGAPAVKSTKVTIYYYTGWSTSYIHYQLGNNAWTTAPGKKMSSSSVNGYKQITIDLDKAPSLKFCFNNGNGDWDNNNTADYKITSAGVYTVKNGNLSKGAPN